jgi:hypothetical protein
MQYEIDANMLTLPRDPRRREEANQVEGVLRQLIHASDRTAKYIPYHHISRNADNHSQHQRSSDRRKPGYERH